MEYAYISLVGLARGMALLPIEHPLEFIKTRQQVSPGQSALNIIKETWSYGPKRFYSGLVPNALRCSIKQAYRFPLMISVPKFYKTLGVSEVSSQNLAGLTIALIESYIICPLERVKTWLMTAPLSSLLGFLKQKQALTELFSGVSPLMLRQSVSWVTFLGGNSVLRELFRELEGTRELSYSSLCLCGTLVGILNVSAIMPLDFAKTHLQKYENLTWKGLRQDIALHSGFLQRLRVVYSGWQMRMIQYIIHALATVSILEKLTLKFG